MAGPPEWWTVESDAVTKRLAVMENITWPLTPCVSLIKSFVKRFAYVIRAPFCTLAQHTAARVLSWTAVLLLLSDLGCTPSVRLPGMIRVLAFHQQSAGKTRYLERRSLSASEQAWHLLPLPHPVQSQKLGPHPEL